MAPRTLPGLGLRGFWDLGEDGWNDEHDEDLRKLSALAQPVVLSRVTALPGSPTDGDIYIVPDGAGSNPNEIAVRDNGAWVYLVPEEGWTAYVADTNENVQFDGTDWVDFAGGAAALNDLTDVDTTGAIAGDVLTYDGADWIAEAPTGGGGAGSDTAEWTLTLAASDETTDLTTGDSKVTFFMATDVEMSEVFTSVSGQSSSGNVTIDIRLNGTTIFSTPPSVNASEDTSLTGTVAVLSTTTFIKGDKVEVDIDAAGTGASGLKVVMIGEVAVSNSLGKHTVWMPASSMVPATTSGPTPAQIETATGVNLIVHDFGSSADQFDHFNIAKPKSWDLGTLTYRVYWTTTATDTDGVAWALEAVAVSDGEALNATWGTPVVVTDDAQSAASETLITIESAALTVGGTPAEGDLVLFRLSRDVSDANDDMTENARLIGVKVFYTINAENDD